MYRSDSFARKIVQLQKRIGDPAALEAARSEAFAAAVSPLTPPMAEELYAYVRDEAADREIGDDLFGAVIDLVWQEYDDRGDPLERRDWEYLKDLVDAYAGDLDVRLIQYVMERIVDRGLV